MSNNRIAVNAVAAYTRSVLTAGLALFSSRWVLSALGVSDFGLFCVVGSIILFVTFLNRVMAGSTSRHFAYSIGQGDPVEVNRWFNSAFGIHLCLASLLLLIGWLFGEYVVGHFLTVPKDRVDVCIWVFRISLVSAFVSMLSVPFVAMFTAKQHITELAVWGLVQSFLSFILAYSLSFVPSDRLLFYASGMVAIIVLVESVQIYRAIVSFDECSIVCGDWFNRSRAKEIFSFATWTLFGSSGMLFRDQGSAILINLLVGPSVNAAYGIAMQVSSQTNQLSASMIGAFSPEITSCEGSGERVRMLSLSQRASKFGTILVLLFAIPLIIEIDYVLNLWLGAPPPYTALFCQLIIVTFLIDRLSSGYMLAVNAYGKIAAYQATLGMVLLLNLPLAWVFLKVGYAPTSIGIAFIITMVIASLGRVLWGWYLFRISINSWLVMVVWPCIFIAVVSSVAALVPRLLLPPSFLRLIIVTSVSLSVSFLIMWFFALDINEREFVKQKAHWFLKKSGILSR